LTTALVVPAGSGESSQVFTGNTDAFVVGVGAKAHWAVDRRHVSDDTAVPAEFKVTVSVIVVRGRIVPAGTRVAIVCVVGTPATVVVMVGQVAFAVSARAMGPLGPISTHAAST
jgi:hypothetical protein